ncbi:MAG: hypothetical protein H6Q75_1087 [Firmicutes bacterium]|nr:hypothetical protein [Bacillota bacterium]
MSLQSGIKTHKKRSPYDKIIKQAVQVLRDELEPLKTAAANQQSQLEKNSRILHRLQEILEGRESLRPDSEPSEEE